MPAPLTTDAQTRFFLRFFHPEKGLGILPAYSAERWDAFHATVIPCSPAELAAKREVLAAEVESSARRLLAEDAVAAQMAALPFAAGQTLVGFGDSLTDDAISWFEILRRMCTVARPDLALRWVNAGVSGHTTADLLARLDGVREEAPDWVFCLIGTNDARCHGPHPRKPMVSAGESEENLRALRMQAGDLLRARWVWMTPPPVQSPLIAHHFWMGAQGMTWHNDDLAARAAAMRRVAGEFPGDLLVDLNAHFGNPPAPGLLDEGLHPTALGYEAFVRLLLPVLAPGRSQAG